MTDIFRQQLAAILSSEKLLLSQADCLPYGYDNSKQSHIPDAVVFPTTHDEVVAIVACCNEHNVPLVGRGKGTGTVGGSVPVQGGVVISFERMNRIIEIGPKSRYIVAEPGVTNEAIQQCAASHGYFWAPDPSSAAVCTIGGNLAYNSAGPRAVKYGTTRENTLGLQAVTGDGKSFRTGCFTTKGVVGYDLTRLLIGSEGTLALITQATLKLLPLSPARKTLQASYRTLESAAVAVTRIMAQPITPYALEFMDRPSLNNIRQMKPLSLPDNTEALLMIELDGQKDELEHAAAAIQQAATNDGLIHVEAAADEAAVKRLWAIRKSLSPALRQIAPKKINEDVVVPVAELPALITGVHQLTAQYQIKNANFGHAGNGNIHVNLLIDHTNTDEVKRAEECLDEIFSLVLSLKGTLSGEHGIGLMKQRFIDRELDATHLQLMQQIKKQFDPNHLLNPGKIWLP